MKHERSHDMPKQTMPVDDYARLRGVLDEAIDVMPPGSDVLILPGGGADALIERLTCYRCGILVCYLHDRTLRKKRGDSMIKVPFSETSWTPFFPERIAQELADRLVVTP